MSDTVQTTRAEWIKISPKVFSQSRGRAAMPWYKFTIDECSVPDEQEPEWYQDEVAAITAASRVTAELGKCRPPAESPTVLAIRIRPERPRLETAEAHIVGMQPSFLRLLHEIAESRRRVARCQDEIDRLVVDSKTVIAESRRALIKADELLLGKKAKIVRLHKW